MLVFASLIYPSEFVRFGSYLTLDRVFHHHFKHLEFRKTLRKASCFQLSSRCLKCDETLYAYFNKSFKSLASEEALT